MANPALRQAFAQKKFIVAPGIFDMISAKVADGMGFDCLYGTGFGTVASHLGVADAGIATYADMVARMAGRQIGLMPSDAFTVGETPGEYLRVCLGGSASRDTLRSNLYFLANALNHNAFMG